mmetsp:Transcript_7745/g.7610  ORF Transcript_7745/g.7610 Transcript_7745/m.7610 type:complete len:136 (+) Transcript_7745:174-581(+)
MENQMKKDSNIQFSQEEYNQFWILCDEANEFMVEKDEIRRAAQRRHSLTTLKNEDTNLQLIKDCDKLKNENIHLEQLSVSQQQELASKSKELSKSKNINTILANKMFKKKAVDPNSENSNPNIKKNEKNGLNRTW